jgi:hypothetical protein
MIVLEVLERNLLRVLKIYNAIQIGMDVVHVVYLVNAMVVYVLTAVVLNLEAEILVHLVEK